MKKKILLVNEDPAVRRMIFRVLTGEGHQVITSDSDAPSLKSALHGDLNLIVFDADIGENNMSELVRLAGSENHFPPVIVLTDRADALHKGSLKIIGIMAKPLDMQALLQMIELAPSAKKAGLAAA
jgi:DNA-binding response OmpR family regulator